MLNYDEVYRQSGFYWGQEPNSLCRQAATHFEPGSIPGKRAIDLGTGEGRDIIHLARQGFQVTGVDISRPGLDKAERWADEDGLSVQTHCESLLTFRLTEPYDLVYSSGTLTFLPAHLRADAFANYKAQTRPGGIHAFNVFVEKPFIPTPHDWGVDEYFYRSGELLAYYWDWEILDCREVIFDCSSGGLPHRHAMDILIARKVTPSRDQRAARMTGAARSA